MRPSRGSRSTLRIKSVPPLSQLLRFTHPVNPPPCESSDHPPRHPALHTPAAPSHLRSSSEGRTFETLWRQPLDLCSSLHPQRVPLATAPPPMHPCESLWRRRLRHTHTHTLVEAHRVWPLAAGVFLPLPSTGVITYLYTKPTQTARRSHSSLQPSTHISLHQAAHTRCDRRVTDM